MKGSRAVLAILAIPAVLSLAACNGGTSATSFSQTLGEQSNFRFVNGSPDVGAVDIYLVSTGNQRSSTPTIANAAYGFITDFQAVPTSAGQLLIYPSGTTTTPGIGCSLPKPLNDQNYTVVIAGQVAKGTLQCVIFQDQTYSASGQYRTHHASPGATAAGLGVIAYGVTAGVMATFTQSGSIGFPNLNNAVGSTYTSVSPTAAVPANSQTTFDFGAVAQGGSTATLAHFNASQFFIPSSTTQPDTANTLPESSGRYNNASLFAVDCTGTTAPGGATCVSGVGIIGSFDSH